MGEEGASSSKNEAVLSQGSNVLALGLAAADNYRAVEKYATPPNTSFWGIFTFLLTQRKSRTTAKQFYNDGRLTAEAKEVINSLINETQVHELAQHGTFLASFSCNPEDFLFCSASVTRGTNTLGGTLREYASEPKGPSRKPPGKQIPESSKRSESKRRRANE